MKIFKIAKELKQDPDRIIKYLSSHGIAVNSPDEDIEDEAVISKIHSHFKKTLKAGTKKIIRLKKKKPPKSKKIAVKKSDESKAKKEAILKFAKQTKQEKEIETKAATIKEAKEPETKTKKKGFKQSVDREKTWQEKKSKEEEALFEKAIKKTRDEQEMLNVPSEINILESITVRDLAKKMNIKAGKIIKKLMQMGLMVTINNSIDAETAEIVASEYDCKVNVISLYDETVIKKDIGRTEDYSERPPIVTIMGHVDHGKTTLLDNIRKTKVVETEHGGITQHIGAYQITYKNKKITFIDTPGHEAFSKMRARGANVTDIVILIIAADDGIMPQTREAVNHAKAAGVPIIVAINKIDIPGVDIDKTKNMLGELELIPEEWGGDTIVCPISAITGEGIDNLLDNLLLQAELLELKGNNKLPGEGIVLEAKIDKGFGMIATILIKNGTVRIGDPFVAGSQSGKVRAILDDKRNRLKEAYSSMPVEITGFNGLPEASDPFEVVASEKEARQIENKRTELLLQGKSTIASKLTLDSLYEKIQEGEVEELNVLIKADVQGTAEAISDTLKRLSTDMVKLKVIHSAAGGIAESDVHLASASNAIIIGFNVRPNTSALNEIEKEKIDYRQYNVIYDIVEDIKKAMEGLLKPEISETVLGRAEVQKVFKIAKIKIAGCIVTSGTIVNKEKARVLRNDIIVYTGAIENLKHFQDEVKEVSQGSECGILIKNFGDVKKGDIIEAFHVEEIARTL